MLTSTSAASPADLLRPEVLALNSYHVPDATGLVKLDAMENPYAWPEPMVREWLEVLRAAQPNRYPDPHCQRLKLALRQANRVPDSAELLLGNGSDEIIQIILLALKGGATVMAPEPTFVMYRQISASLGLSFVGVPLRAEDFALDAEAFCTAIARHRPAVVFLAYPNNPTGNLFAEADVLRVLEAAPGLVVIDEAYAAFAGASFMSRLADNSRLLIMRTLSKLGLAGLRLGFMAGAPSWIEQFEKVRLPYNINSLTQISAEFALQRSQVFEEQVARLLSDRDRLSDELRCLPGVQVFDSRANFILFRLLRREADEVFARLKSDGVLVKNLHRQGTPLSQCLRVTVGTPSENECFLGALRQAL